MPSNELVQSWLLKAAHDLETAKIVTSHLPDYDDVIAFHCQQAMEKALKGYLIFFDIEFKPVHDLGYYDIPMPTIKLTKFQIQEAIEMADLYLVNKKISRTTIHSF